MGAGFWDLQRRRRARADRSGAFLRKACGGDEALRAEIESLLGDDSRVNALLEPKDSHTARIGQRIGSYEIRSLLGVGGMGEVYRAGIPSSTETWRLRSCPRRLPRTLSGSRGSREARVLASLNHPHIGAIYGLEDADGVRALVMELVEGETLAERIARGAIPLDRRVDHRATGHGRPRRGAREGDLHRDLKPANIKVTGNGAVKVLDFGLARIVEPRRQYVDSRRPTITTRRTRGPSDGHGGLHESPAGARQDRG